MPVKFIFLGKYLHLVGFILAEENKKRFCIYALFLYFTA